MKVDDKKRSQNKKATFIKNHWLKVSLVFVAYLIIIVSLRNVLPWWGHLLSIIIVSSLAWSSVILLSSTDNHKYRKP